MNLSIFHILMNHLNFPIHELSIHVLNSFLSLVVFGVFFFPFDVKLLIFVFYWFAVVCTNQCNPFGCWCICKQEFRTSSTDWGARPSLLHFPGGDDRRIWGPRENSEHHVAIFACFRYIFTGLGHDLEPQPAVRCTCGDTRIDGWARHSP